MPTDTTGLSLALALTAGGAVVFAGLTTGIIEILKNIAASIINGHEQLLAFVLSAVWVILAYVSAIQAGALTLDLESGFVGFLAWYGIARIAMGIHDDVSRTAAPLGGTTTT
jgi:hypothetical protein